MKVDLDSDDQTRQVLKDGVKFLHIQAVNRNLFRSLQNVLVL